MTLNHFQLALYILTHQVPFQSFGVELTSGAIVDVHHPEAMFLERTTVGWMVVHRRPSGAYNLFECAAVVRFIEYDSPPDRRPPA